MVPQGLLKRRNLKDSIGESGIHSNEGIAPDLREVQSMPIRASAGSCEENDETKRGEGGKRVRKSKCEKRRRRRRGSVPVTDLEGAATPWGGHI